MSLELKRKVSRRGGSLSITIPAAICETYSITEGDELGFKLDAYGRIIITPASPRQG